MFPSTQRFAAKYRCALRGLVVAFRKDDSFSIHLPVAVVVIALGVWLRLSMIEWLLLAMAIATVLTAELFNTAMEHMARAITQEERAEIKNSLDIAAAAVLCAAVGAKVVGTVIFSVKLWELL